MGIQDYVRVETHATWKTEFMEASHAALGLMITGGFIFAIGFIMYMLGGK